MRKFRLLDTFSGIGGFSLAARWTEQIDTIQFVEIEPFCQKVLQKNFPGIPIHGDIREFDGQPFRGRADILTGGVPCQPASLAGQRKGEADSRWLWGEFLRLVQDIRPMYVLAENPPGIISLKGKNLDWICSQLEASGYSVQSFLVSAANVGAPHLRERAWIVAHSQQIVRHRGVFCSDSHSKDYDGQTKERSNYRQLTAVGTSVSRGIQITSERWRTEPGMVRMAHGIPGRMDRLGVIGNAIVPQVAYLFLQAIVDMETP